MNSFLSVQNVSYVYHTITEETTALKDLSFEIYEGEFIAIVGPSGCGKSTLLSLISGLIVPDTGSILLDGKPLSKSDKNIGYMLQKDHLLNWRTLQKNLTLGLEIQNKITNENLCLIDYMLETYGLISFRDTHPDHLSGGMKQRAALIRTLILKPDLLLLDEPFSALDYQTRLTVSQDIWSIIRKEKKTALLITHDISEAINMADRILVLSSRPGTVIDTIPVHLTLDCERTPLTAREAPEYTGYFNKIWKELNTHEGL